MQGLRHFLGSTAWALSVLMLSGCVSFWEQPGVRQLNEAVARQAFKDWMQSDPEPQVKARIAKGDYSLLGLLGDDPGEKGWIQRWIPGVADMKSHKYDVVFHGTYGRENLPMAEKYMSRFNRLMLKARKGVKLDTYGHSEANEYYIKGLPYSCQ
jgi:hypothetical protein